MAHLQPGERVTITQGEGTRVRTLTGYVKESHHPETFFEPGGFEGDSRFGSRVALGGHSYSEITMTVAIDADMTGLLGSVPSKKGRKAKTRAEFVSSLASAARQQLAEDDADESYEEEDDVDYIATTVVNKKNRTVEISIETPGGKFLTADNTTVERALGEDLPVYMTIPQEVYQALRRGSRD